MKGRVFLTAATGAVAVLTGCRGCGPQTPPPPPPTATVASAAAVPTIASPYDRVIVVWGDGEPDVGPAPLTVQFSVSDPHMTLKEPQYNWDFGDGSPPSDKQSPKHVYERPGKYTAHLTVTDGGAVDDDTVDIVVEEPEGGHPPAGAAAPQG